MSIINDNQSFSRFQMIWWVNEKPSHAQEEINVYRFGFDSLHSNSLPIAIHFDGFILILISCQFINLTFIRFPSASFKNFN